MDCPRTRTTHASDFHFLRVKIASAEEIRACSGGEVVWPETIYFRSGLERDRLFGERIFGRVNYGERCCGKFKRIRHRGMLCDKRRSKTSQRSRWSGRYSVHPVLPLQLHILRRKLLFHRA